MGLSGKYAMRDNGYWLRADGVRGAACMTYIFYPEDSEVQESN